MRAVHLYTIAILATFHNTRLDNDILLVVDNGIKFFCGHSQ